PPTTRRALMSRHTTEKGPRLFPRQPRATTPVIGMRPSTAWRKLRTARSRWKSLVTTTAPVVPRSRKIWSVNWAFWTVDPEAPSGVPFLGDPVGGDARPAQPVAHRLRLGPAVLRRTAGDDDTGGRVGVGEPESGAQPLLEHGLDVALRGQPRAEDDDVGGER